MTLTLNFHGQIWNLLYLGQNWCDCQGMKKIETVNPVSTFCDTAQVPSGAGDMELIYIGIRHGHLSHYPVLF